MWKEALLNKRSWDLFDRSADLTTLMAAAVVAASFIGGLGGGVLVSKLTEPGEYDKKNLEKEYQLARLNKDNQTQQILSDREQAERNMRGMTPKSMRIG